MREFDGVAPGLVDFDDRAGAVEHRDLVVKRPEHRGMEAFGARAPCLHGPPFLDECRAEYEGHANDRVKRDDRERVLDGILDIERPVALEHAPGRNGADEERRAAAAGHAEPDGGPDQERQRRDEERSRTRDFPGRKGKDVNAHGHEQDRENHAFHDARERHVAGTASQPPDAVHDQGHERDNCKRVGDRPDGHREPEVRRYAGDSE